MVSNRVLKQVRKNHSLFRFVQVSKKNKVFYMVTSHTSTGLGVAEKFSCILSAYRYFTFLTNNN